MADISEKTFRFSTVNIVDNEGNLDQKGIIEIDAENVVMKRDTDKKPILSLKDRIKFVTQTEYDNWEGSKEDIIFFVRDDD